ncbi:MAG: GYD domain-containing protein [Aquificaceae bacterium]|nr:GYD domain-containing protein [Aquificaceae bacterium]MDW8236936.1 GYD domain-containing protein [Aquificaceae bacterium]
MPKYVMLTTLTDEGLKTIKEKPQRIKEVDQEVLERFGVKVVAQYALMGPYDFINILEAPDNESVMKMAIELGSRGTIKTLTMPAVEVDNLIKTLSQ